MKEIKNKQLRYYCSCIGELHECGGRLLDSEEELPSQLQRPYRELWTDGWALCCYVVFLGQRPGILLSAEYDEDYCRRRGIPTEYDAQYALLFGYGERLEKLAHEIDPHTVVGLSYETGCDPELLMFIPTEEVSLPSILKLYYLMNQYGFQRAPDTVRWSADELTEFVQHLRLAPAAVQQMLEGLEKDVVLGKTAEAALQYMGMELDRSKLFGMDDLLKRLGETGKCDLTLDEVCDIYTERFGNQLIWKYPLSDSMKGGGAIVPVQEGFLYLPYDTVFQRGGAQYQLNKAEILSIQAIHTLQNECRSYMEGLLAALGDMECATRARPIKRYMDEQGNLYFVRGGLGNVYKAFRRYAAPKPGQRRESGVRSLKYVSDFGRAQLDLDQYAAKHHLQPVEDSGKVHEQDPGIEVKTAQKTIGRTTSR